MQLYTDPLLPLKKVTAWKELGGELDEIMFADLTWLTSESGEVEEAHSWH